MSDQNQPRAPQSNPAQRVPFAVNVLRTGIRSLDMISPRLSGRWTYKLWFGTHRFKEPGREAKWREQADQIVLPHDDGPLSVYSWGTGALTALLVHGWNGRGTQMGAFAAPLVEAGYRVVAFDAPGHGRTPGTSSSIFRIIDALQSITQAVGPFNAIVTHSFGAMVIAKALNATLTTDRVVCISPPAEMEFLLDSFSNTLQIPSGTREVLVELLEKEYGNDIWERLSAENNVANLSIPALIIHDENDQDVPWQQGKHLADAWPDAQWMLTRGLGHTRILRHEQTVQAVVDFLTDGRQNQKS